MKKIPKQLHALLLIILFFACFFVLRQTARAEACSVSQDFGVATQSLSVNESGTYRIWSRLQAPSTIHNSYLLEITNQSTGGQACKTIGNSEGIIAPHTWQWIDYVDGNSATKAEHDLKAGTMYKIRLIGREPNVKLDRVLFTNDTNCKPTTATYVCPSVSANKPPIVSLTAPAQNATYQAPASVTYSAIATDSDGIAEVEFWHGATKINEDTTAPYAYTWTGLIEGEYTVIAKAFDKKGASLTSVPVTVKVNAPPPSADTTSPTAPKNVQRSLVFDITKPGYNLKLSWQAATDNKGVTQYSVRRNGQWLATLNGKTLQYTDKATAPNIQYTYQVTAHDAAGNYATSPSVKTLGRCVWLICWLEN